MRLREATPATGAAKQAIIQHTRKYHADKYEVGAVAIGRWRSIHTHLVGSIPNHSKHGPCPVCQGTDRFRLGPTYERDGKVFCSGGGDGSGWLTGIGFIMHSGNTSYPETLNLVADYLGLNSSLDPDEYKLIREKAKVAKAKFAEEAKKRTHLANQDCLILDVVFNLEIAVKERQGLKVLEPTRQELSTAARVLGAVQQAYPQLQGVA